MIIITESTVTVHDTSTMTEIHNEITWLTTVLPLTAKALTFTEKATTFGIRTSRIISTTAKPRENNLGKNKLHNAQLCFCYNRL